MKILLMIIILSGITLSKGVILDKIEVTEILKFYNNSKSEIWFSNEISKLKIENIYDNINEVENVTPNIKYIFDRDSLINNILVGVYKVKYLDFEKMIKGDRDFEFYLFNNTFLDKNFNRLKYLSFSNLADLEIPSSFNADSLEYFKISNSRLTKQFDINQFEFLKSLDFYRVNNNFDISSLNLPYCKFFSMVGCHIFSELKIINLDSIETFIISDYYINNLVRQDPSTLNLLGTETSELKKLSKIKKLILGETSIYGDISDIYFENLTFLDLHGNNFYNSIPKLNFDKLKYLNLKKNSFNNINNKIESPILSYLDLSANAFNFELELISAPNLKYLDLSNNLINGDIYKILFNEIEFINLSSNNFSSELLESINLDNCYYFNVSNNNIPGNIPPLKSSTLIYLDFSNNEFTNFDSDLELNERTVLNISLNNIDLSDISRRCLNSETNTELITYPDHIIEYSLQQADSLFFKYTKSDIFDEIYPANITQNKIDVSFNYNTRKFDLSILDTSLFEYLILKREGTKNVETDYKVWDQINEKGVFTLVALSKFCNNLDFRYNSLNLTELSVDRELNICENFTEIKYFDLLGNKLEENNIYNKQIIVRYKCLESGEISHKLEIRER